MDVSHVNSLKKPAKAPTSPGRPATHGTQLTGAPHGSPDRQRTAVDKVTFPHPSLKVCVSVSRLGCNHASKSDQLTSSLITQAKVRAGTA